MAGDGRVRKMLFISNLYPNLREPHRAPFNRQQIIKLRRYFDVDIVAPVAWTVRVRKMHIPDYEVIDDIRVFHPTYYYMPRMLRKYHGYLYYWSVKSVVEELLRNNKYAFIFASWLYPDAWAASRIAVRHKIPLFVKVHGTDVNRLRKGQPITSLSLDVVARARKVICVSKALMEKLSREGADRSKLILLYNGIDRSIFYPRDKVALRDKLRIPLDQKILLFVGNLKREKGLDELVHAMRSLLNETKHLQNLRLIVIGEGPYKSHLITTLKKSGIINNVIFLGNVTLESVAQWMCASDVLCLPSYTEGLPNVIVEALSCSVPVVATYAGGIPELYAKNSGLLLVPPRDYRALANAIMNVLENSNKFPKKITVTTTWEENAAALADIFREGIALNNNF